MLCKLQNAMVHPDIFPIKALPAHHLNCQSAAITAGDDLSGDRQPTENLETRCMDIDGFLDKKPNIPVKYSLNFHVCPTIHIRLFIFNAIWLTFFLASDSVKYFFEFCLFQ